MPELGCMAAMERLQGHVLAANRGAGGQWAGGRIDLWPKGWGPKGWGPNGLGHGGFLGFMG
jgi:hypothetical protein